MLNVYTRHYSPCTQLDRYHRYCHCPKWIYGHIPGLPMVRVSARTSSWPQAERKARQLEIQLQERSTRLHSVVLEKVVAAFIADQYARKLQRVSVSKSETLLQRQLLPWCRQQGVATLNDLTSEKLLEFRNQWALAPATARRKHEGLQSLFLFCLKHKWIYHNPLLALQKPHVQCPTPTDYFPREEFNQILAATYAYHYHGIDSAHRAEKIRALILLMRWAGLAIKDAVMLKRDCLDENNAVFLRRAKTGVPVYVLLPPKIALLLRNLKASNPLYFFWSGNGDPRSAVAGYMRSLRKIFRLADLRKADGSPKRCHSHMFRDTFAVEALLSGVLIDEVSVLLGHTSVLMTEKHYLPWVPARQERLSDAVKKTWFPALCCA